MSSTLYARGTITQTGVRQRAERTEQEIVDLRAQLQRTQEELVAARAQLATVLRHIHHIYEVTGIPKLALSPESPPS
jgi:hypothetical protein